MNDQAIPQSPRLLDLFCGAGGAAMGYHRAGSMSGIDDGSKMGEPTPEFCLTEHEAWIVFEFLNHYMQADDFEGAEINSVRTKLRQWCMEHPDL